MADVQREGRQLHRARSKIVSLKNALTTVRRVITGKDVEHIWLNYPKKPEVTLGTMIDKAIKGAIVEDWIPVAQRLPDDDITVLVSCKNSDEPVWLGFHDESGWVSATDGAPIDKITTHWKPMPDGPNG